MLLKATVLSADASAGETEISVRDANACGTVLGDYEDPNYTYIVRDGSTAEQVAVESIDRDAGTWTLASGLSNSYSQGAQVWPTGETLSLRLATRRNYSTTSALPPMGGSTRGTTRWGRRGGRSSPDTSSGGGRSSTATTM